MRVLVDQHFRMGNSSRARYRTLQCASSPDPDHAQSRRLQSYRRIVVSYFVTRQRAALPQCSVRQL